MTETIQDKSISYFLPLLLFPSIRYSFSYFSVYGLLLGAKNIFFFKVTNTFSQTFDVSYQALINPVLLLILFLAEFDLAGPIKRESSNSDGKAPFHFDKNIVWPFSLPLKPYKKIIISFTALALVAGITVYQVKEAQSRTHNTETGLPVDFDPVFYLRSNPGLEEYWKSSGISKTGQRLLNHAEEHYKGFGANDGWQYKYK